MTYRPVESQYSMTATRHSSWEPVRTIVEPPPLNPTYPSCPLGVRVSDLPEGWAFAGRSAPVAPHPEGKLTPTDVEVIRNGTGRQVDLARRYGVSRKTIYRVRQGLTWRAST